MARKIYKTLNGITSYSIGLVMDKEKGIKQHVYFTGGVTHPKFIPSVFETEDPKIQAKLEEAANYGKKFILAATIKASKKEVVKDKVEEVESQSHEPKLTPFNNTSIPTAITTLIKKGWDGDSETLVDIDSVQAAAKTIGITFPNLK